MRVASGYKSPSYSIVRISSQGGDLPLKLKNLPKGGLIRVAILGLIVPFRAGFGTLLLQVAGRSQGQFPHATPHVISYF